MDDDSTSQDRDDDHSCPLLHGTETPVDTYGTVTSPASPCLTKHPNVTPHQVTSNRSGFCQRYAREMLVSVILSTYTMSGGIVLGFSSPTTPKLLSSGVLTAAQATWYQSLTALGTMTGALLSCVVVELTSRKTSVYLSTVPLSAGWLCMLIAPDSYILLYTGRYLTGLAGGWLIIVVILYNAEMVSPEVRGPLMMISQLGVTLGILIMYAAGMALSLQWLSVISMVPIAVVVIGLLFIPESPRWLVLKGHRQRAISALVWLRMGTAETVLSELEEMERNVQAEAEARKTRTLSQQLPKLCKPLSIGITLFILQSFVGYQVILFNAQDIFMKAGFTSSDGSVPAIIIAAVKVLFVFIASPIMDRCGRRRIMIVGGVVMGMSAATIGFYFHYQASMSDQLVWVTVLALILYMGCYAISWGSIPWIFIAESIPLQYRSWAPGAASAVSWVSSFILLSTYAAIVEAIAWSGIFWLFAAICLLGSLFAMIFMMETSRKSLESIEHDLSISVHSS